MESDDLRYFQFNHLPPELQVSSEPFFDLAQLILTNVPDCSQRDMCFQKLLEAKDCAVRACLK